MGNDVSKGIMTQPEKVRHIISKGCEYFGITPEELATVIQNKSGRPPDSQYTPKKFIAYILLNNTALTNTRIMKEVGWANHSLVNHHCNRLKDELSDGVFGYEKTKMIYNELITYLNL